MSRLEPDLRFAILPTWLLTSGCSDKALRVYAVLANRADRDTHQTWPGRSLIAAEASCSLRSVDRAIEELIELGALSKQQRRVDGGWYQSSVYTVHRMPPQTRVTGDTTRVMGDADPCHGWQQELEPKNQKAPTTAEPDGAGSPAGSHSYARALVDKLSQKGIDIDEGADRDAAYRELLVKGMAAFPDEKALPNRVIGEYLTACDISLDRKGWAIIGRNLKAKAPLTVFDAVAEAVRWGAGTGDYEADPASFAKYVAGILGGKR